MDPSPSQINLFRHHMERVYGPTPSNITEAAAWIPPNAAGGFKGRYLWTDAFGVVNFLTLHKYTGDETYLVMARNLVQTVHDIQGWARDGKSRLPGATDENPLGGGLRIGKEDEEDDGQYHHYLTLWMFALHRLTVATLDHQYNSMAIRLAKAIHPHFCVDRDTDHPRMVWKVTTDLLHPLVKSQGNLDPIDGYTIMRMIDSSSTNGDPSLEEEINDYKRIMDRKGEHFVSNDSLDLGMALWTSQWFGDTEQWAKDLQKEALQQLEAFLCSRFPVLGRPGVAFRDFGACMGIGVCEASNTALNAHKRVIVREWELAIGQTPEDMLPITRVMYAAALIPGMWKKGCGSLAGHSETEREWVVL